jgi:2-dehydro-3-deoxyphosphogluconate aldolase/(4S)-4-hydroxy-2-oxoglutarate aldolase
MAKFTKHELYDKIEKTPIVPLFTHADGSVAKSVLKACYDGGIKVFEYTNRSVNSKIVFEDLVQYARSEMPDLAIGIGTIFNSEEANFFIEKDADFIIQPIVNQEVGKICRQNNIAWFPGAMTFTEVFKAQQGGADIIKIFPANIVGTSFIKAIKGPMPNVKLMATGGVLPTIESLREWFTSGVSCVGIGSQLCSKEIIETKDYARLQKNVEMGVAYIEQFNIQNF